MQNKKEIFAGIVIIGNEILSGRTIDTNTSTLSIWLNSLGIKVQEVRTIPDIEKTIIDTVNDFRKRFDYVFTSGGIGPTHDDITSESISKVFNMEYGPHKEAFSLLENYYKPGEFTDGRQKMAHMPMEANLILNPSSGAPGFYVENVFCLPGVPSILKSMLGDINNKLIGGQPILTNTLNLRTVESEIAKNLSNVQDNFKDIDIGSYPFFKAGKLGVSIVLRGTDEIKMNNCKSEILKFVKAKNIELVDRD